ncbi:hypothetical protein Csa_023510, partial [Cucumis sativus]
RLKGVGATQAHDSDETNRPLSPMNAAVRLPFLGCLSTFAAFGLKSVCPNLENDRERRTRTYSITNQTTFDAVWLLSVNLE